MPRIRIVTSAFLALAVTIIPADAATDKVDSTIRLELEHIAKKRIYFGHQSVGKNLLDGIKQLSTMAGVPIRVVEAPTAGSVPPATFGHKYVQRNEEPLLKLQNFEHAFGQQPSGLDIALIKFCFVDIKANTDVKALFARYQATINSLQAKNPGTTFVHVTAPLTRKHSGPKEFLKRLLGRSGSAQNMRRGEYNTLLRKTYQGHEPIFDLARVESTAPDGTAITDEWNGNTTPAMATEYTNDGGHLNSVGKLRAARELISVLASIPDK